MLFLRRPRFEHTTI